MIMRLKFSGNILEYSTRRHAVAHTLEPTFFGDFQIWFWWKMGTPPKTNIDPPKKSCFPMGISYRCYVSFQGEIWSYPIKITPPKQPRNLGLQTFAVRAEFFLKVGRFSDFW